MKRLVFMVSSMNVGGVEKSLLSLLSVMPRKKYDITLLVLEKKGGFLASVPNWIRIKEVSWYKQIKPIIMQPPQTTIRNYYQNGFYLRALQFLIIYFISKTFNNRYLFYKHVFKD